MELKEENRILVKEGLKRLKVTKNLGLQALIEVNGIDSAKLSAYHLGFVIGPCLNATGRLDTALRALELLESSTKQQAMSAAAELKSLNDSRKNLTQKGVEEGIIAGKIRESYYKPVFVLTKGEEGVKGSGRSIETYHMYENMTAVKHCFSKFGGHKLAAGMSLASRHNTLEEDVEAFRKELNECCTLTEDDLIPRVHIDVPMPVSYATKKLAEDLNQLEPFGVGNPKPLFAQKDIHFIRGWKMGAKQNFARYKVRTPEGMEAEMVFFGSVDRFADFLDEKYGAGSGTSLYTSYCDFPVSVTYQLSINTYRGNESLQFIMQNYC